MCFLIGATKFIRAVKCWIKVLKEKKLPCSKFVNKIFYNPDEVCYQFVPTMSCFSDLVSDGLVD